MSTFNTLGYQIVYNAISPGLARHMATQFKMLRDNFYYEQGTDLNENPYHDNQVEKSFCWYSAHCFEALMLDMTANMEEIVGKQLYPTYSYARIYHPQAEMAKHVDRPSCEYSATITISVDPEPWEIWMEDLQGNAKPILLPVGSMVVYQGTKLPHWRNTYSGNEQIQAFMHYVDREGDFKNHIFDTRPMLGLPPTYKEAREGNNAK